ncbi:hypothetical protein [Mycobacterium sp. GA-2829]|uniref:hypothetical protein n=1 Tax=Mycobacterium sp. GA-2829 TaxID=1772283 RepID=UPI00073FE5C2|nr:hypothetical protein [Mycobacterium sp. GA-2829]KUI36654.1 hypothetical protein AU194_22335 [Mycobacterium sp. GA-2829]
MNGSQKVRRWVGGAVLCGGVLAATVGLGSGAAQAAVPTPSAVPETHVTAVDTGFAEFRPAYGYGFHPGREFFPRPYYNPWLFPRPYGFHGYYR